ncbi:TetR/AcrR family transcriptional regulator [Kineococcus rhizosphaerae]|uniref:TetR family transcriptional regulator n=1 Tax=Kineococcus rhizosphaerae TaxID=559628 RepID=A0A2T0QYP0_9ACTN|nr:TetR/AcrR family transcriptional regulator [Kineococcus rhizosphaerae]PRY11466.1 TetR family transcriptional regulator [Kineococcus rhizosphaerae]
MTALKTRRRPGLEKVLSTADRLFYEAGIHATGVDTIAAEAGVSKTTMYTYFRTKEDLVAEYLRGRSRSWQDHVADRLGAHDGSGVDKLLLVFDLLGEWFDSDGFRGCPFTNAEAESEPDAPAHQVNLAHRAWVRELFAGLLRQDGLTGTDVLTHQLAMLYDGAMTGAHAEPGQGWAVAAREAARALVAAAGTAGDPGRARG